MNVESVFRPLSSLERSIGGLYARWAAAFADDRAAAFLFVRMSNEEKGHASLVDYQRRVVQRNPDLSGNVDVDLGLVEEAIRETRLLRESAVAPRLEDALRIAYRIETSAAESHYRNAVKSAHPELERLLSCLGSEDREHLERLRGFAGERGVSLEAIRTT
ncbi:MAG: hypothetical protein KJ062_13560 [Thermoanaerobaculia bacterium]|nr:hypothetical protein [Thermoanaerobaculia bacterium]